MAVPKFGTVVPLAFRETLRISSGIAVSNLYWIILSQVGSVALGAFAFKQTLKPTGKPEDWAAVVLLLASAGVAFTP